MFNFFKKNQTKSEEKVPVAYCMGIEDIFYINGVDAVVVGKVRGTMTVGDAIYISNPGEDKGTVTLTEVSGLEVNRQTVTSASNTPVGVMLKDAKKLNLRIGSVIYTRTTSAKDVHDAYIRALGDSYISMRQLNLSDHEKEELSLTDLAELRRLFSWLVTSKKGQETEELRQSNQQKLEMLAELMCKKLFEVESFTVVMNKQTGEPHMFCQTMRMENGQFMTSPPDILILTDAYMPAYGKAFDANIFELKKIEKGEDGKGIEKFFLDTFYLNGACGLRIIFDNFAIDATKIIDKPDYSNLPEIQVPVTNPDVERWLLVMGQMNEPKTDEEKQVYMILASLLDQNLLGAKFLVPMKSDKEIAPADEDGKTVIKQDTTLAFPTMDGKYGRPAVRMFTDWKRLQMEFKPEDGWSGMIETIGGMIQLMDVALNATEFVKAGCYIGQDYYNDIVERFGK